MGLPEVAPARRRWPPVEIVRPGPEGRAPRLMRALQGSRRGFLFSPLPGYGIAAVCRSCGEPATCGSCGGALRSEEGAVLCVVCGAPGRCARCGGTAFGLRRGGAERVEEWAGRATRTTVRRLREDDVPRLPARGRGPRGRAGRRPRPRPGRSRPRRLSSTPTWPIGDPGLSARERALTTWMEAVAWAYPHGRAIVQSSHAGDPAVQALVRGKPDRFHADEAATSGATPGSRSGRRCSGWRGPRSSEPSPAAPEPITMLVTSAGEQNGMLARARPRDGARVRRDDASSSPSATSSHARRGRAASMTERSRAGDMILDHPHAGRPRAQDACAPVTAFDERLRKPRRRHGRDDVRGARRGTRRAAGRVVACACSSSTTARRDRGSWRTPCCRSAEGEEEEEEGCLSIPGPFHPTRARPRAITAAVRTSTAARS